MTIFPQTLLDLRRAAAIALAVMAVTAVVAPDMAAAQGLFDSGESAAAARQRRRAEARRAREGRPARQENAAKRETPVKPDAKLPKVVLAPGPAEPLVAVISVPMLDPLWPATHSKGVFNFQFLSLRRASAS